MSGPRMAGYARVAIELSAARSRSGFLTSRLSPEFVCDHLQNCRPSRILYLFLYPSTATAAVVHETAGIDKLLM